LKTVLKNIKNKAMLINTNKEINNPKINQVVFFQPWKGKNDHRKKPYPVIINSGNLFVNNLMSNFWYWQRITPSGRIRPEIEHGYGNFFIAEGYELQRKITIKK